MKLLLVLAAAATLMGPAERLAKWQDVAMPAPGGLSERERHMVAKLVEACRHLDELFLQQMDKEAPALSKTANDPAVRSLFAIMGSRWDLLDEHRPFFGAVPMPPGREYYPHDLTRSEVDRYVAAHPAEKDALFAPYTVVKRVNGRLVAVPYRDEYRRFLEPMAQALREAADLSGDPAFADFLRLRATALLTDDYYQSDLAWLDLKDPKFDLILAPYETYLDGLLGVKASFGAAVMIRNEAESRNLAIYQRYVPQMQDALPVEAAFRPSKHGRATPMEVVDAPYRAGDLRHGYQVVADNLPNDPRVHAEKGSKKIFFKNFMDARVKYVVLPVARIVMDHAQAAKASGAAYLAATLMHEIAHDLGPEFATVKGKRIPINEAIGPATAALEEAKADVAGMFGLGWLVERGVMPKARLEEYYASYVAGLFRTLRFGAGEAHGRAEMMEFNYLLECKALARAGNRYVIDYARIGPALARLAKELLEIEATGDRARCETWFATYGTTPAELKTALAATARIPVDIRPVFAY
jgi:hypothetical protein